MGNRQNARRAITRDLTRAFLAFLAATFVVAAAIACESASTPAGAVTGGGGPSGGDQSGGQGAVGGGDTGGGSGGGTTGGAGGTTGGTTTGGAGGTTGGAGGTTGGAGGTGGSAAGPAAGSGEPASCDVPKPVCAGLSGCELTICYRIANDEMPADCSCLSGDQLTRCCAQVREVMADCLDLTDFPECEGQVECPMTVIDGLKANPYPGAVGISPECESCLCSTCITELVDLNGHGETGVTLLQCAVANNVRRDCVVCNPAPCDTTLGSNLLTGPCGQEVIDACPNCTCSGPFDLMCLSLAGCLEGNIGARIPCSAAHAALECIGINCPACPTLPDCPSNFM